MKLAAPGHEAGSVSAASSCIRPARGRLAPRFRRYCSRMRGASGLLSALRPARPPTARPRAGWEASGGTPALVFGVLVAVTTYASTDHDWPTRGHDVRRGGVSAMELTPPLSQGWVWTTSRRPTPAWTQSPAVHDHLHDYYDMKPRQAFDQCFHVAVVGDRVYFGSSVSGAVTCLDNGAKGQVLWTFFTDGPVRFAPHVAHGNAYFGSDDGYVYCVGATDGALLWKERAGPSDEMLWGNEHMISAWPVRTSVLVDGGAVYWGAGIFPQEGLFLCKRNAADGKAGWTVTPKAPPQGYLLATPTALFVPTGKTFPYAYARGDGACLGAVRKTGRDGGCWALVSPDNRELWSGPTTDGHLRQYDASKRTCIATVPGANRLLVNGPHAYFNTNREVVKVNRRDRKPVWRKREAYPFALIMAGGHLFAGGDSEVAAFGKDGEKVWAAKVDGKAYGLAAASGCLFVSTDKGSIYSFRPTLARVVAEDATDVTETTARLKGRLVSAGGAETAVHVCWGAGDAGADREKWPNAQCLGARGVGLLSHDIAGLRRETVYCYRFLAVNSYGHAWSPPSQFMTGEVSLRAAHDRANEDESSSGVLTVIRPDWAKSSAMTVLYRVAGTATPGADYEPLAGSVAIPRGTTSATITVRVIDDVAINEPDETVTVTLARGPYIVGDQHTASVTITDNDRFEGWRYRAKIEFSEYDRPTALVGFPVLVTFREGRRGFSFGQFASPTRGDLCFTDAEGTQLLHYEIERWNPKGASHVWVQVPKIASGKDHIWAYWGRSEQQRPAHPWSPRATWQAGYKGVWHMTETQGPCRSSTRAHNAARAANGVKLGIDGVIGRGVGFDGDDDEMMLSSILPIGSTDNTVSVWVKVPKVGAGGLKAGERVGDVLGNFNDRPNSNWELHAKGQMRIHWNGGQAHHFGTTDLRDDTWRHVAWVRDRAAGKFLMYIDGKLEKTVNDSGRDIEFTTTHRIGGDNRGAPPNFHGLMDELRVSSVARSGDWLWACWKNQLAPDEFASWGAVERLAARR